MRNAEAEELPRHVDAHVEAPTSHKHNKMKEKFTGNQVKNDNMPGLKTNYNERHATQIKQAEIG